MSEDRPLRFLTNYLRPGPAKLEQGNKGSFKYAAWAAVSNGLREYCLLAVKEKKSRVGLSQAQVLNHLRAFLETQARQLLRPLLFLYFPLHRANYLSSRCTEGSVWDRKHGSPRRPPRGPLGRVAGLPVLTKMHCAGAAAGLSKNKIGHPDNKCYCKRAPPLPSKNCAVSRMCCGRKMLLQ